MNVEQHRYESRRSGFDALARSIGARLRVRRGPDSVATWTYLDSFDWRLYARDEVLIEEAGPSPRLDLLRLRTGASRGSLEGWPAPRFALELPEGPFRERLEGALEMRALLPQVRLRCRLMPVDLLDGQGKVVARLRTESAELLSESGAGAELGEWIVATPIRGYEKAFEELRRVLEGELGLVRDLPDDLLTRALAAQGRRPGSYSSRLDFHLDPDQAAAASFAEIFGVLGETLEANLEGTIADWDSEFLHDLRVAVRRTRSALKQLAAVSSPPELAGFRERFARLGAATGPARDLDVYLLDFPRYQAALPRSIQADLEPLHELLCARKVRAHEALVGELRSERFAALLPEWRLFLAWLADPAGGARDAGARPILQVASERIWKLYRRVWREGQAIGPATPGPALHDLRKRCKELRYAMEFFRSLYPGRSAGKLIRVLKDLQETLGSFQDLEVQIASLLHMSHELAEREKVGPETLLAMGALIEQLERERERERVRGDFRDRFARYASDENREIAAELFRPRRSPRPASAPS